MEAKDADRSHQDICHFMATACLISDKASSPVGTGWGRVGLVSWSGGGGSGGCARRPVKVMWCPFFKQLVPITANHMRSVPLIIIPGSRHQSRRRWALTRGCAVISGLSLTRVSSPNVFKILNVLIWRRWRRRWWWWRGWGRGWWGGGVHVGREWCPAEIIKT